MEIQNRLIGITAFALLCASVSAQNDECAGALAAPIGTTAFDTSTATLSAAPWPCATGGGPDLWYTFTAPSTGVYTIDLCGSTYDTALELLTGNCAALVSVDCNDDFCGTQSGLTTWMSANDMMFVRVGGWNGSMGAGTLNITDNTPPPGTGNIGSWISATATGLTPSYINWDLPCPIVDDIGLTDGTNGVTYEFFVWGDNTGASSALMGARGTGVGDEGALKYEQWNNTEEIGTTAFGVADHTFPGSNMEHQDIHLVFCSDPATGMTELFFNGVSRGTVPHAPVLQGHQGIGQVYDAAGHIDPMPLGAIRGVAVYEGKLSPRGDHGAPSRLLWRRLRDELLPADRPVFLRLPRDHLRHGQPFHRSQRPGSHRQKSTGRPADSVHCESEYVPTSPTPEVARARCVSDTGSFASRPRRA